MKKNYTPYKTLSGYTKSVNSKVNPSNVNDVQVTEIKSVEQKSSLLKQNILVVNFVYADWCGPCSILKPHFQNIFAKYNSENVIAITKENVDYQFSQVQVVPTVQYFLNGKLHSITTGADANEVENHIVFLLKILNGEVSETPMTTTNAPIPDMTTTTNEPENKA